MQPGQDLKTSFEIQYNHPGTLMLGDLDIPNETLITMI